jgi:catechol 2,3-dioxygenase-like lactoylglutathione lyase family enzyme
MKITQLNHVALHVADLERSCRFYRDVLGLEPMPRPAFDFDGAWFRIGRDQELHLIARAPENDSPPRERHYALLVDSFAAAEERLRGLGQSFRGPQVRPDGALQLFLRDPDGHVVELCSLPPAGAP